METTHYVAIIGGAVAGSEAAAVLQSRGIKVAVFDQNALPYGKIEYGLPKWHHKTRDRQEALIDQKLDRPGIRFIPNTMLGRDMQLKDVLDCGFSAVLLASGAWKDRPLPVPGIDRFVGKGLYYQNPLMIWFNQNHDPNYDGPQFQLEDGALVVGGGLASIDVAKVVMIETTREALEKRGFKVDALTLEKKGIPTVLADLGLKWEDLNLQGCRLLVRRGIDEMALVPLSDNPTPEELERARETRKKIIQRAEEKYLFKVVEHRKVVDKIVEDDRLAGLVVRETHTVNGQLKDVPGSEHEMRSPLVIASIGSIPQPIPGIPMTGEVYKLKNSRTGQIDGYDNVFALGNAVTGKGNIRQSMKHAREVTELIVDNYVVWRANDYVAIFESRADLASSRTLSFVETLEDMEKLSLEKLQLIDRKIDRFQQKVGYVGDYKKWIREHLPLRLESMGKSE